MKVFDDYASYYNLLYKDKDYHKEVLYVDNIIQELKPGACSLLDIGCGTGMHDVLLKERGYTITGIDLSKTMVEIAEKLSEKNKLEFKVANATTYRDAKKYDVVVSLFHVVNYQTSNDSLRKFFNTAASHLDRGGLFIFDSWYGPALLSDKPQKKVKVMEDDRLKVKRNTQPTIDYNENVAHIFFHVEVEDKASGHISTFDECHSMRYLFNPEVELLAETAGFRIIKFNKWMSDDSPGENSWYVLYGLIKN